MIPPPRRLRRGRPPPRRPRPTRRRGRRSAAATRRCGAGQTRTMLDIAREGVPASPQPQLLAGQQGEKFIFPGFFEIFLEVFRKIPTSANGGNSRRGDFHQGIFIFQHIASNLELFPEYVDTSQHPAKISPAGWRKIISPCWPASSPASYPPP